ncbi:MBL fold metallo-hydrolase [Anaeromassilibacillus senegalensis]|uniref:MBL fold metallo-hydrolase n=1 Tax=Anaeromassilibacillus senegalensis TaxID=1673717 RepID=A0ABS9CJ45_9FIRM|nr:MBL fold metallo-hydrolase [Anaeromassilibacillus senegalensis]MCF2651157.1 MBL fold metallo-hydrolase [Anaeromassilibacillus senegalensis]
MRYTCITGGPLAENCYVLADETTGDAAVIDPGFENDRLMAALKDLNVRLILLTHGHFDHIGGAERLREKTGAPIASFETEAALAADPKINGSLMMLRRPIACTVDRLLQDSETFTVGTVPVTVLHTPGHTAGGCCYITPEAVFTGDTLMGYSIGRCDMPTGDESQLMASLQKLTDLPGDPDICGGHGPVTTLLREKRNNPYL